MSARSDMEFEAADEIKRLQARVRQLEGSLAALAAERDEALSEVTDGLYAIADGCIYGLEAHDVSAAVAARVRLYSDDEYLEIEKGQEIIEYLLTEARNCTQIEDDASPTPPVAGSGAEG